MRLTIKDLNLMAKNASGFSYFRSIYRTKNMDICLIKAANKLNLNYGQLFLWVNSALGKWSAKSGIISINTFYFDLKEGLKVLINE